MIEPGEPITMPVTILNIGAETATSVTAKLRSLTAGVTVTDSTATYADIPKEPLSNRMLRTLPSR
jgi:hypothetical protein